MPLEIPLEFNGLTMNDQSLQGWGIASPADHTTVIYASDAPSGSGTASVITDTDGSLVLQETQTTAAALTTADFAPDGGDSGDFDVQVILRASSAAAHWTVELLRNDVDVLASYDFTGSSVMVQIGLGVWTVQGGDSLSLRCHRTSGAGNLRLARIALEPRTSAPSNDWYVKVDQIDGLFDADVRDERYPNPGQDGESSGSLKDAGKTITITARVIGRHLTGLRQGQRAVVTAFDDDEHALYWGMWDARDLFIRAKKNQKIDMPEAQTTNNFQRKFTVQVRADDPRSYTVVEQVQELPLGAGGGGLRTRFIQPNVPDYPIQAQPRERAYAASSQTSTVTIENAGMRRSWPVIELYGPMQNPVVQNAANGKQLVWTALSLDDGDFVAIDMREGLILRAGVSPDYTGFDAVDSEFFQLEVGLNPITVVPFSSGTNAKAVVRWRDAY